MSVDEYTAKRCDVLTYLAEHPQSERCPTSSRTAHKGRAWKVERKEDNVP